ncbi:hypothetical protein [Novosphingopyxis sp.]|uniref:hypothetical protein n=1 Tax=Novosphingopyxis sp. TaxID=2709690 RepID=UPI003B591CE2
MTGQADRIEHPSPHRHKVSAAWLLAGLAIPPAAWTAEMLVGFAISSNACPLTPGSNSQPGFSGEAALLILLQLACLICAIASGLMSRRHWRRVRGEKKDSEHSHLTIGEGRTRFLALAGMLTAGTFAIAILFNVLEPILIPLCWSL